MSYSVPKSLFSFQFFHASERRYAEDLWIRADFLLHEIRC